MSHFQPDLSIILQVGGKRERAAQCLSSLLQQEILDHLEIILLDYEPGSYPPLEGSEHPIVRTINRPAYEPIGLSRAIGVQEANAPVVAFIEDHCIAYAGWAQAIVEAHAQGWMAIGCEVHTANSGIGISDAIALMNYAKWLSPARSGIHDLLVGHNTAYDRNALLEFGDRLALMLRCDPVLQWKLQEEGHALFLDPRIKVGHINETEIAPIVRGYFLWNRVFAPTRASVFHWSSLKRLVWTILTPLIPPVRILKQLIYILRTRPSLIGQYVQSLPVQVIAHYSAAAGQAIGLVLGIGNAEESFLRYELNQSRRVGMKSA